LILLSIGTITGRQLKCNYYNDDIILWPSFYKCKLSNVYLSKTYESEIHSFSGPSSEKSKTTVVQFQSSPEIDFLPKEIPKEFPNLIGLIFSSCNLPIIKNELFSAEFIGLEYLSLWSNQIDSIEPFAFQHLKNLKWLRLWENYIQSLPFNLFRNNPNLFYLDFRYNQINSISPNLLKKLNKLKYVDFLSNQCVDKEFGCATCSHSVSQSELHSGLSSCFQNCLNNPDCAIKSGRIERLSIEKVRANLDLIISYGNMDSLIEGGYTVLILQSLQTNLAQELANISENLSLKYANEKLVLEHKVEKLEQEIKDLKKESRDRENALKQELNEIISKRLEEFELKLKNEARP
jgi:Leucine-rich repeat (LRR) protein